MDLGDIQKISLADRKEHYRKSWGAYDMPMSRERLEVTKMADEMARDEILEEVYAMLCHTCNIGDE